MGKLDVESVHQSQVAAELPRACNQWGEKMTLERCSGNALKSGGHLTDSQFPGALKASQRRERVGGSALDIGAAVSRSRLPTK